MPRDTEKVPVSPSVYSQHRMTRISTMTFGKAQLTFTGTPSQLMDAPKPLFAQESGVERGRVRPARPRSAEPLGRLSGMGYGLGLR
jgi:hypothetical protein